MSLHSCDALVVTCIDFRFQKYINDWIESNIGSGKFDRVALAGGVFNFEVISGQVDVSKRLHDIKKVVLMNHEDCGAYGELGTMERLSADLNKAGQAIKEKYPEVEVELYVIQLDGQFTKV